LSHESKPRFKITTRPSRVSPFTTNSIVCPLVSAVTFHQRKKEAHYGTVEPDAIAIERRRYAGGTGSYPLVGRPERIADEMIAMHKLGLAGATISFVNFNEELPFFVDRVLPLLHQAGLRDATPHESPACLDRRTS
jgi:alkanesulfonate monooxygenase SsuD/methylene tetrahydromethanopterin reductase-like flavin-dependent oxidoreductase (luciferase family)